MIPNWLRDENLLPLAERREIECMAHSVMSDAGFERLIRDALQEKPPGPVGDPPVQPWSRPMVYVERDAFRRRAEYAEGQVDRARLHEGRLVLLMIAGAFAAGFWWGR